MHSESQHHTLRPLRQCSDPTHERGANDSGEDEREKEPDEEAFVNKHYFSVLEIMPFHFNF